MKISECRRTAGQYMKGRYGEAFVVTAACLFVFTVFKSASALIVFGTNGMRFSSVIDGGITVLRFLVMTPLITGGAWWFFRTVCGEDNSSLLKLYSGFKLNSRAVLLYALMWSKAFFSLFPTALCFTAAYIFLYGRTGFDSETSLFLSFQLSMLGIVLIFVYLNALMSMILAPFLFIDRPDSNPFGVIRKSSRLMKGNKLKFAGLAAGYIPAMLPIVTIPFVLPRAVMSAAVFARDIIKENTNEQ